MAGATAIATANAGGAVAWVVPTYKNARPVWRFCERILKPLGGAVALNKTERTVEFPSGGWLGVYSADNDVGLRGESFDLVIVDEAAQVAEETYTDVILPTLADRDGRCMLISTPKGLNWFYLEHEAARREGEAKGAEATRAAWQAPSSDNPMPTIRRAAELAKERVSERTYLQEWLAQFVADGAFFSKVLDCSQAEPIFDPEPGHAYGVGCDWGRTDDATVFSVMDLTTKDQVWIERLVSNDFDTQRAVLRGLFDRYHAIAILAEQNGIGYPQVEALRKSGLPVYVYTASNATKARLIEDLELGFKLQELWILPDTTQRTELLAYQATRTPTGMVAYGAPPGGHDDTVIALALSWQLAKRPPSRPQEIAFEVAAG